MAHVFISYSHDDADFANTVITEISRAGHNHWIDVDQIRLGDDWQQKIDAAIRQSFALILIVTPTAQASENVTYEWIFALGARVQVIPLIFKTCEKLHPKMPNLTNLDMTEPRHRRWDILIQNLKKAEIDWGIVQNTEQRALNSVLPTHITSILDDLRNPNNKIRRSAITAVKASKIIEAVPVLIDIIRFDNDILVRKAAAEALGGLGAKTAIPQLIVTLGSDEDSNVRMASVYALGELGEVVAQEAVMKALGDDSSPDVRMIAASVLGSIGERDYSVHLLPIGLSDNDQYVRDASAEALRRMRATEALWEITEAFSNLSLEQQNSLIETFSNIDEPKVQSTVEDWKRQQHTPPPTT